MQEEIFVSPVFGKECLKVTPFPYVGMAFLVERGRWKVKRV